MREIFPAYFRPDPQELNQLWTNAVFAVDANVLLNLYRYSPSTRQVLEDALQSVRDQLFLPHQVAREFLRNRLGVIAGQSKEYTTAADTISSLLGKLADKKRHPFISDDLLNEFQRHADSLKYELEEKRDELLNRLTKDERLSFIEAAFSGKTGQPYTDEELAAIANEGETRFSKRIPPGYMDAAKSSDGDDLRKYGDLILWKQLIDHSNKTEKPVILISDDSKEDWWLEQSGRTIGPRIELREEFIRATSQDFWIYSIDSFLEHSAELRDQPVNQEAIAEVQEIRTEAHDSLERQQSYARTQPLYRQITDDEMLRKIRSSEKWAAEHEGFISLNNFIHGYLRGGDYDFDSCYSAVDSLEQKGLIEIYEHQGPGHPRPVRAVRIKRRPGPFANRPLEGLRDLLDSSDATSSDG